MAKASPLARRLYAHLRKARLIPRGSRILVACSGGPDSLALLALLLELRPLLRAEVVAAHFEHGIRGAASRKDAAFVRAFCGARGVSCAVGQGDAPGEAARRGLSLEAAARELRYAFLEAARRAAGAGLIATAHHADDQAETVLLHLLRGTGLRGLGGMPAWDGARHLARPLLPFPKAALVAYCQERGLAPRHDATNDAPLGLRNRVRLGLLPLLQREYNPRIGAGLCRLAALAAEDEAALAAWAAGIFPALTRRLPASPARGEASDWQLPGALALAARPTAGLPPAIARRVLRLYLAALGHPQDVSRERTAALLGLLAGRTGDRVELPWLAVFKDGDWLRPGQKAEQGENSHDAG